MQRYTLKYILVIIGATIISGCLVSYLYGWLYGVVVGTHFMSYLMIACYKNPNILQFCYPEWMETKDVWKIIGCCLLFVCGVAMAVTGMSESVVAFQKTMLILSGYIFALLSGFLTRHIYNSKK